MQIEKQKNYLNKNSPYLIKNEVFFYKKSIQSLIFNKILINFAKFILILNVFMYHKSVRGHNP